MKILWINNYFGPFGGAERCAYGAYKLFGAKGHDVYFFATDFKPFYEPDYPHQHHFVPAVDYDKVTTLWKKLKNVIRPFYNHLAQRRLEAFLKEIKPDVVHCDNIYYHLTSSVLKACQDHHIPVVMTLHDVRLMCPAGTLLLGNETYCQGELCVGKSALPCISNRCYQGSLSKSVYVAVESMFRNMHRLYDIPAYFIAPSRAMRDLAVRAGMPAEKINCVNNFITGPIMHIPAPEKPGRYFLTVGRLSVEKGLTYAIEAMTHLSPDYELRIVGTGPQEAELRALVKEKNLSNVLFLGHLDHDMLIEQYKNCIATLIPSIWFENFGLAIIESMACGRPVIGTRMGGIGESIIDGTDGYVIPPNDSAALATAMRSLFESPEKALQMGLDGQEKIRRYYNESVYYEKLSSLYQMVSGQTA